MAEDNQLGMALKSINLRVMKYDPEKARPVKTNRSGTISLEKLSKILKDELAIKLKKFPEVMDAVFDTSILHDQLLEHAKNHKVLVDKDGGTEPPEELEGLTLNCDMSAKARDDRFFLTHEDETVSRISGEFFLSACGLCIVEATAQARKVIPEYLPRSKPGIDKLKSKGKESVVFNKYIPPLWKSFEKYDDLPDKLPSIFEKLVNHLFPVREEREYFFAWLHASMFSRAFVYLVLCGAPGTGKNRLKLILRALHGHANAIDGKRSTLVERFNSQLSDSTLAWFDELHYDMDMENIMKELQNDTISIERKGVDATRATRIYASLVISNNKPRDNYIAFDARKFVPLQVTSKRLEQSMTKDEIDQLTDKVENEDSETFDVKFLAQIAKWIKKHGHSNKWPQLEYKGPMFYTLAHTSMSRWQKKAATIVLEANPQTSSRITYDEDKGYLWSSMQEINQKKHGDKSLQFPDFTTIKYFFDIFKDGQGRKAFKTKNVKDNIMGDFWVKPLFENTSIITESRVLNQRGKPDESQKENQEIYDL